MTPTPSQGPPIPQGGGGMMGYDHDHGSGGGGGTRNLEHIYCNEWHCGIPSFRFAEEFFNLQPKWTGFSSLAKAAKNCSSVSSTSSACASKAANDHFQST